LQAEADVQRRLSTLPVLLILAFSTRAGAQSATALPVWDVSAVTGLFVGMPRDLTERETYDNSYHVPTVGITFGRHFTPHLKVEGEALFSSEGERFVQRLVTVPGLGSQVIGAEQKVRTHSASASLVWQFFENQWVHPFVLAGATVDFDRERIHTYPQSFFRGDPRLPGDELTIATDQVDELGTHAQVRGLLGVGIKVYVSRGAFVRLDSRAGVGATAGNNVALRIGMGFDF
jgi:Outer membrane protein beta-barrel domain